jgi:hypothetical protein
MSKRSYITAAAAAVAILIGAGPASAEFSFERRFPLPAGAGFTLTVEGGLVHVIGDETTTGRIAISSRDTDYPRYYRLDVETRGDMTRINVMRRHGWMESLTGWLWPRMRSATYTVHVPPATPVYVRTSGGRVRVENIAGPLRAYSSGGSMVITGAGGRVDARTSGGQVNVAFARGNAAGGELSTSGGNVTATVDPSVRLSIDAATSGGVVVNELPVTTRSAISRQYLRGDLNGGGSLLRLRSSGGRVRILAPSEDVAQPAAGTRAEPQTITRQFSLRRSRIRQIP